MTKRLGRARTLGLILAVCLPQAARAQPAAAEGVGTYDCAEFARAVRAEPSRESLYFSWAQGWMSGWNLARMDAKASTADLTGRPIKDQEAFVASYCARHPAALYMEAVYRLYAWLKPPGG